MKLPEISIHLPPWVEDFLTESPAIFPGVEDRMRFVLALARQNVQRATGGPFAAAVFDKDGRLIAPGVNMVVTSKCSVFHSEIVALAIAQKVLGRYDLSDGGMVHFDLFSTTEPCAMCFGAIPWSGVRRLVCGARGEDALAIGFDEGPKLDDWVSSLNDRGIAVLRDILRKDAVAVLQEYVTAGGTIYHAGRPVTVSKR
ncbi:MAG: nucleoside deaminase [Nitrospirae bacterium]|nr:nucleoside deaminase [Nitrospirota bacterium]